MRWVLLLLAALLGAGAQAAQGHAQPQSVVVVRPSQLSDLQGRVLGQVQPCTALEYLGARDQLLAVRLGQGETAYLPSQAALILPGPPEAHAERLERLERSGLGEQTLARLLAGRIEENDSTWLVELAWGRPQRRFMVNLFYDEEHLVYLRPGREPVLLRFRGGRLTPPLPAATLDPAPVETSSPPR